MFLAFCAPPLLSDPSFVAGLDHRTAAWVGFLEQFPKKIAMLFVEITSLLPGADWAFCVANLEESETRAVLAIDVHGRRPASTRSPRNTFPVRYSNLRRQRGFRLAEKPARCTRIR